MAQLVKIYYICILLWYAHDLSAYDCMVIVLVNLKM